jgi:hypothetical protein
MALLPQPAPVTGGGRPTLAIEQAFNDRVAFIVPAWSTAFDLDPAVFTPVDGVPYMRGFMSSIRADTEAISGDRRTTWRGIYTLRIHALSKQQAHQRLAECKAYFRAGDALVNQRDGPRVVCFEPSLGPEYENGGRWVLPLQVPFKADPSLI